VGCINSVLSGARLRALGSANTTADTLQLSVTGVPEGNSVLFFQGSTLVAGGAGAVFGDGLRCAGGTVVRLGVKSVSFGVARYPELGDLSIAQRGFVPAGATRVYQCWYLEGLGACGSFSSNTSNAFEINWQP
jgi:hypothetical protein